MPINPNDEMVFKAIDFAVRAHRGQYRKGTSIPYVIHPLNVSRILIEANCDASIVVAGILHDTLEDTQVTIQELRAAFGDAVADHVAAVSEVDKSAPWEARKQHTLERLASASQDILLLALADKLDNIRSIWRHLQHDGEAVWIRFNRPRHDQAWYYENLLQLFDERIISPRGRKLCAQFRSVVKDVFSD